MGSHGPHSQDEKEIDNSKYYDLIGVSKTATKDEIKKAFRKKAIKEHPDNGGDAEKFKDLSVAYETLMDDEKRKLYDRVGEEGMKEGGGAHAQGFGDIFDLFGMGGHGGARGNQKKKTKPIGHVVSATLEDLYLGKTFNFEIERQRLCSACNGVGGSDASAVQSCKGCKGRGMKTVLMQMGPGMYSQRSGPCEDCRGTGEVINEAKRCKTCRGKKIKKERKKLSVEVDKGSPHACKQIIHGEADQVPDAEPGDVVIQVKQLPHKLFKRKGADLQMEKEITLLQALTGVSFTFKHLDGRVIHVVNEPGEIVNPEQRKTLEDMGMPFYKKSYKYGSLFIDFKIKFPDKVEPSQIDLISKALSAQDEKPKKGKKNEETKNEKEEIVKLIKFEEYHRNTHHGGGDRGNDSDEENEDDDGMGGQRVGCQSQ